jgi:2-acylglycerol O-acyltransferase 2
MFGVCPHGIVPYSLGLLAFGRLSALFNSPRIVIASVVRWIPVFSQVLKWGGAIEATDAHMSAALNAGQSLAVTPGGIAEMFYSGAQGTNEVVVLGSRKGFVRHAIKHGAALVPVYVFGANRLFHRVALPQAITDLSRYLRASIMLFFGRFGLPIPFPTPLVYAVGQSILLSPWPSVGPPTQDEVDFVHNAFIRSLVCAFDENKTTLPGWMEGGGAELHII